MKKLIALTLTLTCVCGLVGCKSNEPAIDSSTSKQETQQTTESTETTKQETQETEATDNQETDAAAKDEVMIVRPLPNTVNIDELEDCTLAVSLEKGDFYKNEDGNIMMDVTVFTYDLYDMMNISLLNEGDIILRGQEEVVISSIERNEHGLVFINGGLDNGGFDLFTEEDTVYFEHGYSDIKAYYELGKVSLPVSTDFVYEDTSDLDKEALSMDAENFLNDSENIEYSFNPNNTSIRVEGGEVKSMIKVYTP